MASSSRGQSAMEYLMTYGWAILVVMVVGIAMWRLGIFNLGGSGAPTSTGFATLKPLLSTCEISNKNTGAANPSWWGCNGIGGFYCQFLNTAGTAITITNVSIKVNNRYCDYMNADLNPKINSLGGTGNCGYVQCYNTGGSSCDTTFLDCSTGTAGRVNVPKDAQFTVNANSPMPPCGDPLETPCKSVQKGQAYEVFVDVQYEVNIGGARTTKHSSGTVRLGGTG
ncbi:MAG: hypothetical protein NTU61_00200 [Candidatus Altiarchaeota archaeon]|nr:hypothetical protein [Candidatus Altiarchaeota archaeon]